MLETLLSNRTVSVLWEALPRILSAGLTMTIPLTLVSFTLAMVMPAIMIETASEPFPLSASFSATTDATPK